MHSSTVLTKIKTMNKMRQHAVHCSHKQADFGVLAAYNRRFGLTTHWTASKRPRASCGLPAKVGECSHAGMEPSRSPVSICAGREVTPFVAAATSSWTRSFPTHCTAMYRACTAYKLLKTNGRQLHVPSNKSFRIIMRIRRETAGSRWYLLKGA